MSELMEVMDQQGRRMQIPREEYASQIMGMARQNWENLDALRQLGPQLLTDGFANEALEIAKQANTLSGGHVPDLYWLAAAYAETGNLEQAAGGFEEIREDAAYPVDQARAAMGLARVRVKQGRGEEAFELLEWAIETDPQNPQLLLSLYGWYHEREQADEGIVRLHQIADSQPENPAPWRALAQVAGSARNKQQLKVCGNEALKRAKQEDRQNLLAEISGLFGQLEMPLEIINLLEPVQRQIQHPFALMNLAQAYADIARKEDARQVLQSLKRTVPAEMQPMIESRLQQLTA